MPHTGHKLSRNKTCTTPQYFCFVDTETRLSDEKDNRVNHSLRLGVAIFARFRKDGGKDKKTVYRFLDTQNFWDKVEAFFPDKSTVHIIAHNAVFDMTILKHISSLTKLEYDCQFVFEQGLTFISKWKRDDKRIMILDNANWFAGKLAQWGEVLNLPKLTMPDNLKDNETWFVYCERDTEILYQLQCWLIKFIESNDLGNWRYTRASLSLNAYKHRFMTHNIFIPPETRETYLARQSYKGGRTECFKVGIFDSETFYKLDINSMYPYVMRDGLYPVSVKGYVHNPKHLPKTEWFTKHCIVSHCRVKVNEPYLPYKVNNHTCFPIGEFDCFLTTPELSMAIENNWLIKVYEYSYYSARPIFTDFVDFFYKQRLLCKANNDPLRSLMFKLTLNSLYGKFGQRGYEDTIIGQAKPGTFKTEYGYDRVTGIHYVIRQFGRNIIRSVKKGEGYNSFVAIASHVTAYARIMLYDLIKLAGRENTYYTDTDSLIVNEEGYQRIVHLCDDTILGALKLEGTSKHMEIVAPKHYLFGDDWTMKGVRKNAQKIDDNVYRQEVWPGINRLIQNDDETYYNYFITKTLSPSIRSGNVDSKGNVNPFILPL